MRLLMLAALAGLATAASPAAADPEASKQLYRSYIEDVVNKRQPEAADRYLAVEFIEHNPNLPQVSPDGSNSLRRCLPDSAYYHGEIQEILAEGNKLVVRVLWTGTQDGPFIGLPASGNKLRFSTADFFRVEDGKLAEHWDVVDSLPRAIALGLVPAPKPSGQSAPAKSQ
jgi:predicted ester cyclase